MIVTPFAAALQQLHQPPWLFDIRREALAGFLHAGLPERSEDWRYTSLAHLDGLSLHLPTPGSEVAVAIEDYPGALRATHDDLLVWQDTQIGRAHV
jgi:hypothetical protein